MISELIRRRRTVVVLASTLALAGTFALGAAPLAAQESGIPVGSVAPDAALELLDGTAASLAPVIKGKAALIEFWATWCANCKQLEPTLVAAQKKYGSQVAFVGVAVSVNQSTERVKRYTAEHMLGFIHFYDRRGNGVENYDVPATSYVVVVNKEGEVVYTGVGGKQDIESAIQRALR